MTPLDFLSTLLSILNSFDNGKIYLCTGTHAHKITTKSAPKRVWLTEADSNGVPVCGGGINLFGYTLLDDGFVLYAEVASDTISIEWQASL